MDLTNFGSLEGDLPVIKACLERTVETYRASPDAFELEACAANQFFIRQNFNRAGLALSLGMVFLHAAVGD